MQKKKENKVKIDYKNDYIKELNKNCDLVLEEIEMKQIPEKYALFCKNASIALKTEVKMDELFQRLKEDPLLRYCLATKPNKQSFHEKYAAEKIAEMPHLTALTLLDNSKSGGSN